MDIQRIRDQIPATKTTRYFNTGWSGPSPLPVTDRIRQLLEHENAEGPTSPPVLEKYFARFGEVRSAMAALVNAVPGEISLAQNTTEGLNTILNGMDWRPGDEIVTCTLEHHSVLVPAHRLAELYGVKVRMLEITAHDDRATILEKFDDAVGPATRLIFLSHIQYACGLRMPVRGLARIAHDRGAWILLDGAQGVGQLHLDMKAMDCDFYAFPGHKWLLGPDGVGGLYIKEELIEAIRPSKVSGWAVKNYESPGDFVWRTGRVEKYELTTTSGPLWAGLIEAIGFIDGLGTEAVEARGRALAAFAADRLARLQGVTVLSPTDPETSASLVAFAVEGWDPKRSVQHLWERGRVVCRSVPRPEGVRLSTAFFNTEEELEVLADLVGAMGRQA